MSTTLHSRPHVAPEPAHPPDHLFSAPLDRLDFAERLTLRAAMRILRRALADDNYMARSTLMRHALTNEHRERAAMAMAMQCVRV